MKLPPRRCSFRLAGVLVATAGGLGLAAPHAAQASCAAPALTWQGPLRPGATIVLHGHNFFVGCDDTGGVAVGGCRSTRDPITGPGQPADDVRVTVIQDGKRYLLGIRDADEDSEFKLKTALPRQLEPGRATLRARGDAGGTAKVKVEILPEKAGTNAGDE